LTAAAARLLDDPDAARAMGEAARRAAAEAGSVVDGVFTALTPLLPAAAAGRARP
jgi:3-deoxy-D-manno-octulosonic-acid transferase